MDRKVFHAYVDGFADTFYSVAEIQAWVSRLGAKYPSLKGKELVVHTGRGTIECALYVGAPFRKFL